MFFKYYCCKLIDTIWQKEQNFVLRIDGNFRVDEVVSKEANKQLWPLYTCSLLADLCFFSVVWHHTYQKADQKRHFVLMLVMGREKRTACFLREVKYCLSHLHNHSFSLQNWAKFVSLLQTQKKYSKEAEVLWKLLNEETLIERLFCPK